MGRPAARPGEAACLPHHLADGASTNRCQLAPQVLGDAECEAFDLLGRPGELGAEILPLGRDAGGTRVEVALAGHVAADGHEGHGPEGELLRPEECGHEQVTAGLQAAVHAQHDPVPELIAQEHLVHLGETQLPRSADILDGGERASTCTAGLERGVAVAFRPGDHRLGERRS